MDYCSWIVWLLLLISCLSCRSCHGWGPFTFDMHHGFSDSIKGIIGGGNLPKKGSVEYYAAMVHRDRIARGRRLADEVDDELTFANGNETFRASSLGFLHYANVSLGTPSLWFLVALDTGSDLFWVPCDCSSCVKALRTTTGRQLDFNIYSPAASSTSKRIPCESNLCPYQRGCSKTPETCQYQVLYLSNGTSSSGILVEDVLHLIKEDDNQKVVDQQITFGCGQVQTGSFLEGAAPNGLLGLGIQKTSVPSLLHKANLTADSFAMCFGRDGIGRFSFGDKGSADQEETPLNINQLHPTYNISATQVIVGTSVTNVEFNAIFDSGTSFTYLNDPVYGHLSDSFDMQVKDKRRPADPRIPFEYCYETSSNPTLNLTLTMGGGSKFPVLDPLIFFSDVNTYCLGVIKSPDVNIIGQNFMTGYHVVFDREKLALGWKASNCFDDQDFSTIKPNASAVPPATAVFPGDFTPQATSVSKGRQASAGKSSRLSRISLLLLSLPIFVII